MTSDLTKAVEQLRTFSPKLNEAADNATIVVEATEHFLNEVCAIGIPASQWVSSETVRVDNRERTQVTQLAYERFHGNFGIGIKVTERRERWNDEAGEPQEVVQVISAEPWSACPRSLRLEAFPELPNLLETISREAEWAIQQSQKAAGTVTTILDALGRGKAAHK